MDARVGDVALAERRELFAEVRRVLVLDLDVCQCTAPRCPKIPPHAAVRLARISSHRSHGPPTPSNLYQTYVLDDGLPAALVVDLVPVAGRVDDVELEPDAVLGDDVRLLVDLGRLPDRALVVEPSLRVDEVRREQRVDQGRLAEPALAC